MKKGIFIERDGILNEVRQGPKNPIAPLTLEEFRIKTDAEPALRELKAAGFVLIVTTHQPGLSRGDQSRRELDRMHDILRRRFPIDDLLVCPHEEADYCPCRTPRPGLLIEAAFKWQLNLEHSFIISDKWQDAEAGRFAGCTSLLVQSPWVGKGPPGLRAARPGWHRAKNPQPETACGAGVVAATADALEPERDAGYGQRTLPFRSRKPPWTQRSFTKSLRAASGE